MSSYSMCDRFQKLIDYEIQCLKKYDLKLNCLHILKSNLCNFLEFKSVNDLNIPTKFSKIAESVIQVLHTGS